MRVAPILSGVLGLALLEASLSSSQASSRVGQLFEGVATVVSHVLSPTVPAIPDLRHRGGAAASSTTSGSSTAVPAAKKKSTTMPADWTTSASALYV